MKRINVMKKIIALSLVMVLLFSLCACGETQKIEKALQGSWETSSGVTDLCFDDGTFEITIFGITNTATYEVQEDAILITYENGHTEELTYTWNDGDLMIQFNGMTFTKVSEQSNNMAATTRQVAATTRAEN